MEVSLRAVDMIVLVYFNQGDGMQFSYSHVWWVLHQDFIEGASSIFNDNIHEIYSLYILTGLSMYQMQEVYGSVLLWHYYIGLKNNKI